MEMSDRRFDEAQRREEENNVRIEEMQKQLRKLLLAKEAEK